MNRYEYVSRSEYTPVREELEKIICKVQSEMRKRYDLPFQFRLIGSGRRHLVTRIVGGNRGYDFDYDLIIQPPGKGYHYNADIVKQDFTNAFKRALKGTAYSAPKDSTSVITIKVVEKSHGKILYSCDFAIIYYENGECYSLRNNKKQGSYAFVLRAKGNDIDEKLCIILKFGSWNDIRNEYLKLKNSNQIKEKRSFSLYIEAINNVYNQLNQKHK